MPVEAPALARPTSTPADNGAALLLSVRQVAALLCLGERTVWKLSASGRMPAPLRIGRAVRWRRVDLERFIHNGCVPEPRKAGAAC